MSWLGGWFDPELEELFRDEPELLQTAQRVRASRPEAEADPRFRNRLRGQLLAEASRSRGRRGVHRWWQLGPAHVAWGGAAVGAVLIGATVLTFLSNHPTDQTIVAISPISAQHAVSTDNVITVAFNQPMDKQAVESGVHIQPATKVSFSWNGNSLVISPLHHLTGNTPYTVTIVKSAIRSTSGVSATKPIAITFGTAPSPAAGPQSVTPTLAPSVAGANGVGGSLLFAPDGSVVSTAGMLPTAGAPATPVPTPTTRGRSTPTPIPTPTPEGVITQEPSLTGSLVAFPVGGAPVQLGPAASAAAYSPNGRTLAMAVDDGNGGSKIIVAMTDGSQPSTLADSPTPVTDLTWSSNGRLVYTDGAAINAVDLSGKVTSLYTVAGSGTITALDPGGTYAYIAPSSGTGGDLLDIAAGSDQVLQGAVNDVAFSGDGTTIAWVDESGTPNRLLVEAVGQNAPASVATIDPSATLSGVTLDQDGGEAAYLSAGAGATAQLIVAQLPSGSALATGIPANASALALSPAGDQVAYIANDPAGAEVDRATVPGATSGRAAAQLPAAANSALHAFVEAQVRGDIAPLAALSGPGVDAASSTPQNLSRAYVISTYLGADGAVSANIELIVDPNAAHATARVAGEALTLSRVDGDGYIVTALSVQPLRDESSGPHVVAVGSSTEGGVTTLQVSFDSDLDPLTVAAAITVMDASGTTLQSTAVYDADSRTATVTIAQAPAGVLTLEISAALSDVNGQSFERTAPIRVGTSAR